jgi:hypothetical protein
MFVFLAASAAVASDVNGGATTISTPAVAFVSALNSRTYASVSCVVLNIFQLAARTGVRMGEPEELRTSNFELRKAGDHKG